MIGPAYTPELGLSIAGGAMLSFVADEGSPRSSFPATIGYGSVGAVIASGQLRSYFGADTWRLDLDLWYKDMTDHYFGVGYDAAMDTELGDDTTLFVPASPHAALRKRRVSSSRAHIFSCA